MMTDKIKSMEKVDCISWERNKNTATKTFHPSNFRESTAIRINKIMVKKHTLVNNSKVTVESCKCTLSV